MSREKPDLVGRWTAVCLLLVAAGLSPQFVNAEAELPIRISANLISTTPGASGTTAMDITIESWSSDDDRAVLLQGLQEGEQFSMVDSLRSLDRVGSARLRNRTARDLRYSREFMKDGKRHIVLATDRPIAAGEVRRNNRTLDNNVSIVHLELDENGRGEGTFMAGAELELDAETGNLTITHLSMQPVRMTRVRTRN